MWRRLIRLDPECRLSTLQPPFVGAGAVAKVCPIADIGLLPAGTISPGGLHPLEGATFSRRTPFSRSFPGLCQGSWARAGDLLTQ
jgi:hypothetical protein